MRSGKKIDAPQGGSFFGRAHIARKPGLYHHFPQRTAMDGQLDQFVNELKRQLGQLDRRIRSLALLRGLGFVILALICLVTLQITLDFVFSLGNTARIALSAVSVSVLLVCLWFGMLRRVFHKRTPIELAAIVEESQSSLNERLTSVLELSSAHDETSSVVMRERLARETIASLTTFNITDSVPSDRAMRFVMSAGIAILIFLTPLLIWPDAYRLLISRSVVPWGNFATVSSLYFEVEPGDGMVARGEDLEISATPHWHTKKPGTIDDVWIEWQDAQGEQFSRRMDLHPDTGHYTTQFSRMLSGFSYAISSGNSRSKQYTIQVTEPPSITDTRLVVTPPQYTGAASQELSVLPSELSVLEQSQLSLQLTFDRPVSDATLFYQFYTAGSNANERPPVEQQPLVISEDKLTARLELPVNHKSFLFHVEFKSNASSLKSQTSEHLLKVITDRPPEIELTLYNQPEFFKPQETLTVPVKVLDDYGVTELELHIQKLDEKSSVVKVPADQLGNSEAEHEFKIKLPDLKADQADIFTYRIKAADNREVPGPNVTWSTPRVFGIDKNAEQQLSAGVVARQQKLRDELKKIQQEFQVHHQEVEKEIAALKGLNEKEELPDVDQEVLQELTKTERKLAQKLETVANEFLQLPLYQKLAEQTQNVARTDFVKNHDTLKSAAAAETLKQARQELKPVPSAMDRTEEKIDGLVKQYEKLVELENDLHNLDRLAEETDHLANDMLAFNEKLEAAQQQPKQQMKEPPADQTEPEAAAKTPQKQDDPHQEQKLTPEMKQELANLQAELKHRQSRLTKDLDDLLERRPELVDAARNYQLKQLDSLVKQTSQLVEPQQQLAEAIQEQAPVGASRPLPRAQEQPDTPAQPADGSAPPTASPTTQSPPPAQGNDPQNAATAAAEAQPAQNSQPAETNMSREPSRAKPEPVDPKAVLEMQRQQQELADAAAKFLLETAQEFGPQSEPTQKAAQMAREAIKAEQEASAGRFHEASQAANRAAKMAQEIQQQKQSRREQEQNTDRDPFLEEAERMANLQEALADKLENASTSEAARQAALKNSQQALAQQTQELTRQLSETSRKLETEPIELQKESQQAEQSRKKTAQASQSMQKAVEGLEQENLARAAEQARQAAQDLQTAARQSQQSRKQSSQDSPVPEKVGDQVTDAAQQLRKAQQQLQESPEFKNAIDQLMAQNEKQQAAPRDADSKPDSASPADQKEQASESGEQQQQDQGNSKSGKSGKSMEEQLARDSKSQSQQQSESGQSGKQSASKQAAESLKQAAESLSQAATELKSKAQQGSDPGKGQQSQTASRNMAPGKGQGESEGGGARTTVDFSELQVQLKAMSNRNWGELPGQLDTEILQGSRSRTDPEYARLIKHYFEAIAKSKPDSK